MLDELNNITLGYSSFTYFTLKLIMNLSVLQNFALFFLFLFYFVFFSLSLVKSNEFRLTDWLQCKLDLFPNTYIHTVYYGLNLHVMTEVLLQPPLQTLMHSSMWLHFHWFFSYFILFFVVAVFSQGGRILHDRLTTVQSWTVLLQIMG